MLLLPSIVTKPSYLELSRIICCYDSSNVTIGYVRFNELDQVCWYSLLLNNKDKITDTFPALTFQRLDFWDCLETRTMSLVYNKQLLDEVEHDIMSYQNRGLC